MGSAESVDGRGARTSTHRFRAAALVIAGTLASSAACSAPAVEIPDIGAGVTASPVPAGADAVIERVVDGDTVVLQDRTRVRLIGIDTPESVAPDAPVECFGPEAAAITRTLLPAGTEVRLEDDRERFDRFGRRLAYLYRVSDGLFVNATLVAEGAASTLSIKPNTKRRAELTRLEDGARSAGRGLWGACP
jgi:micrococcal nuclease